MVTDMVEVQCLEGVQGRPGGHDWNNKTMEERISTSKSMAEWAPGLVFAIGEAIKKNSQELTQLRALSAKERQQIAEWQAHANANHTPYRKDCLTCLESLGKDRQRRSVAHPESFCLSLDLCGPFQEGHDQEHVKAKYMLWQV